MMSPMSLPEDATEVTASADPLAGGPAYGLYVGTAGNVTLTTRRGNSRTFKNCAAGSYILMICTHVTAMTAADVLALR
jgi:hypothetical protein